MMRRTVLAATTIVLAAVTAAPAALAAPQDWNGSQVTMPVPPERVSSSSFTIASSILRDYDGRFYRVDATTELLAPPEQEAGCTTSAGATEVARDGASNRHAAAAPGQASCNGVYTIRVTARLIQTTTFGGGERVTDTYVLPPHEIHVVVPPPDVTAAAAAPSDDRSVVVGWTPVANPPPDMLGYVVERVTASGETATIATIDDPAASSYTDTDTPAEGGTTTYRVRARRSSPQGEVTSAAAAEAPAEVAPAPQEPDDPGGDPDPDAPGGDSAGAGGGGTTGGTPGGGRGAPFRAPNVGRSSGRVVPPLSATVTTLDTGFDQELPFGDRELGGEDPVLPDDEFASMIYDDEAGRGLLIPIATGLLLAVWAVHLRYLAAAAKPQE